MEEIVNIAQLADRIVVLRLCKTACDEKCGVCIACRRACPPLCENGIDSGTGHVFAFSDRVPVKLLPLVVEARNAAVTALTAARTGQEFTLDDETQLLTVVRQAVVTLLRQTYPDIAGDHLDGLFDIATYLQVLERFFGQPVLSGIRRPIPQTSPTPAGATSVPSNSKPISSAPRATRRAMARTSSAG